MQYVQLFKYSSILFLIVQTTFFVLILRYSRKLPNNNESIYVSSTAVACVELIKLVICLLIIFIVHASN